MWPFDHFRKRKYTRRYKAALVVLLGVYAFERLSVSEKARAELETTENFRRSLEPPAAWKRWAQWDVIAAFRATAMERIGIEPGIVGLSWPDLLRPWNHWRKWSRWPLRNFDGRAAFLVMDFSSVNKATADAKAFLRANGMSVPEEDPWALGNLDSLDGTTRFLKDTGLVDYYQKPR